MGIRGPIPEPAADLKLRGSWRAKGRTLGPAVELPAVGDPPEHLNAAAKAEWRRVLAVLPTGIVTAADLGILSAYCIGMAEVAALEQTIERDGRFLPPDDRGAVKVHPAVRLLATYIGVVGRCAAELGLSPASRRRVHPAAAAPAVDDREEQFFGRNGA